MFLYFQSNFLKLFFPWEGSWDPRIPPGYVPDYWTYKIGPCQNGLPSYSNTRYQQPPQLTDWHSGVGRPVRYDLLADK
jgi:hypothetical protein